MDSVSSLTLLYKNLLPAQLALPPRAASYSEVVSGVKQIPGLALERKFNVVVYGIQESTRGTLKHQRQQHDLEEACNLISSSSNLVSPGAIRDCLRLGKYTPQLKRPRSLLVMLNRTADVRAVLSNRSSVPTPYRIKPDLSPKTEKWIPFS